MMSFIQVFRHYSHLLTHVFVCSCGADADGSAAHSAQFHCWAETRWRLALVQH